jgi:hypothetical protein
MTITLDDAHASTVVGRARLRAAPPSVAENKLQGSGAYPKLRVRVCSSVKKHAAEQRVEQESTVAQHRQLLAQMASDERSSWCQPQDPTEPAPPLPHSRFESIREGCGGSEEPVCAEPLCQHVQGAGVVDGDLAWMAPFHTGPRETQIPEVLCCLPNCPRKGNFACFGDPLHRPSHLPAKQKCAPSTEPRLIPRKKRLWRGVFRARNSTCCRGMGNNGPIVRASPHKFNRYAGGHTWPVLPA